MFGFLLKLASKLVKSTLINPVKKWSSLAKNTGKAIAKGKYGEFVAKGIKKRIIKTIRVDRKASAIGKRLVGRAKLAKAKKDLSISKDGNSSIPIRGARTLTTKEDLIGDIMTKSALLEQIQRDVYKIGATMDLTTEISTQAVDINKHADVLKLKSTEDLQDIRAYMNSELKDLGVDLRKSTMEDEEYQDIVREKVFHEKVDQWQNRFFDSDVEDVDGTIMDEARKDEIWEQIEAERIPKLRLKLGA